MRVLLPLLAGAAAVHANQSGVDTILVAFNSVANWTSALTTALNNFTDVLQAGALLEANNGTLTAILTGTQNVSKVSTVSPLDALQLAAPTINLVNMVNKSIETIITKKETFTKIGLGQTVYDSLQSLACASSQFSNMTISKLPGGGITIASKQIAAPIPLSFEKGIAIYSDQKSNTTMPAPCTPVSDVNPNPVDTSINGASLISANSISAITLAVLASAFFL